MIVHPPKVLVFYYANSSKNIQPVVYSNSLIQRSFSSVQSEGMFYVKCHTFEPDDSTSFEVFDRNRNYTYLYGSKAKLSPNAGAEHIANLTVNTSNINDPSFDFSSASFVGKRIRIKKVSKIKL